MRHEVSVMAGPPNTRIVLKISSLLGLLCLPSLNMGSVSVLVFFSYRDIAFPDRLCETEGVPSNSFFYLIWSPCWKCFLFFKKLSKLAKQTSRMLQTDKLSFLQGIIELVCLIISQEIVRSKRLKIRQTFKIAAILVTFCRTIK